MLQLGRYSSLTASQAERANGLDHGDRTAGRRETSCSRRVGVTWPAPPHSGQALRRNGRRLGTSPLPWQTGHCVSVGFDMLLALEQHFE